MDPSTARGALRRHAAANRSRTISGVATRSLTRTPRSCLPHIRGSHAAWFSLTAPSTSSGSIITFRCSGSGKVAKMRPRTRKEGRAQWSSSAAREEPKPRRERHGRAHPKDQCRITSLRSGRWLWPAIVPVAHVVEARGTEQDQPDQRDQDLGARRPGTQPERNEADLSTAGQNDGGGNSYHGFPVGPPEPAGALRKRASVMADLAGWWTL